ncbi:MAG: FkbM family methyltransferase [Mesorhizobium sp.]|nr:MAG: FkbM family methyltransferase [Mesorhizobium sp.]
MEPPTVLSDVKFWAAKSGLIQELRDIPLHFQRRESYAQHGEDTFLLNTIFKGQTHPGRYLDIGASHPVRISNTYLLYLRGWSGVVVEPISRLLRLHQRWRPRDTHVQCLIGESDSVAEFFLMYPSVLSTTSPEQYQHLSLAGHRLVERLELPQLTLGTLLQERGGGKRIDFASVDIEGIDWIVAKQIAELDERLVPRCLCIESNDEDANLRVTSLLRDIYRNKERLGVNTIFWNDA